MIAEDRLHEATSWFMRVRAEDFDTEELTELNKWLQADPKNRLAYGKVAATWDAVGAAASSPELMVGRRDALEHARRAGLLRWKRSRSFASRYGLAASFVGAGLLVLFTLWTTTTRGDVYQTVVAERRILKLSDGSVINLDARSRMRVEFDRNARNVTLESGQASFRVMKDASRPFRVSIKGQTIVALGTQFNVDIANSRSVVTLIEGAVAVVPSDRGMLIGTLAPGEQLSESATTSLVSEWPLRAIELSPGQQLVSVDGRPVELRSNVDLEHAVAWQNGKLFFHDESLASAAERMNRHSIAQIKVAPDVAQLSISGSFNAADVTSFVDAVSEYFPLSVTYSPTGDIHLAATGSEASSRGSEAAKSLPGVADPPGK